MEGEPSGPESHHFSMETFIESLSFQYSGSPVSLSCCVRAPKFTCSGAVLSRMVVTSHMWLAH